MFDYRRIISSGVKVISKKTRETTLFRVVMKKYFVMLLFLTGVGFVCFVLCMRIVPSIAILLVASFVTMLVAARYYWKYRGFKVYTGRFVLKINDTRMYVSYITKEPVENPVKLLCESSSDKYVVEKRTKAPGAITVKVYDKEIFNMLY